MRACDMKGVHGASKPIEWRKGVRVSVLQLREQISTRHLFASLRTPGFLWCTRFPQQQNNAKLRTEKEKWRKGDDRERRRTLTGLACANLERVGAEGTTLFLSPDTSNASSFTRPPRRLHSCSHASVTTHLPLATALRNLALRTLALGMVLVFFCTVPQTTWVTASVYLGSTIQPRLIFGERA